MAITSVAALTARGKVHSGQEMAKKWMWFDRLVNICRLIFLFLFFILCFKRLSGYLWFLPLSLHQLDQNQSHIIVERFMPSRRSAPTKSEPALFLDASEVQAVIRQPTVGLFFIRSWTVNHAGRKYWERAEDSVWQWRWPWLKPAVQRWRGIN